MANGDQLDAQGVASVPTPSEPATSIPKAPAPVAHARETPGPSLVVPAFYTEAEAMASMSGVAAPLLAGGGIATIGIVVQQADQLRWPGVTLLLLVMAVTLLVLSVQLGFVAGRHASTPEIVRAWWTHVDTTKQEEIVVADVTDDRALFTWWSRWGRMTYGWGVVILWLGVGSAVAPDLASEQAGLRWAAAGVAWATTLLELGWLWASRYRPQWFTPRARIARREARRASSRAAASSGGRGVGP